MPRSENFIEYACRKIGQYDLRETNLFVILPTLRLKRTLSEHLTRKAEEEGRTPCFLPQFTTIDRIIAEFSLLRKAQPAELLAYLYLSYCHAYLDDPENPGPPPKSLDQFWDWGKMLLSDFNQIDNQLAPTEEILQYVAEEKRIANWHLDLNEQAGQLQNRYLQFYRKLWPIYRDFTRRLLEEGCAYAGLSGRTACRNLPLLLQEEALPQDNFYLFVGLNALTLAEKNLIKTLVRAGKAETVWNADRYYMEEGSVQEAGHFLRQYRQDPDLNHNLRDEDFSDNLRHLSYRIFSCPQNIGQAKLAARLLEQEPHPEKTVVVLNDESLFAPLMNALPASIPCNVSIASSLSGTLAGNLFHTLAKARETVRQSPKAQIDGQSLLSLLRNPFFEQIVWEGHPPGNRKAAGPYKGRPSLKDQILFDPETTDFPHLRNHLIAGFQSRFDRDDFRRLFPRKAPYLDLCTGFIFPSPSDKGPGEMNPEEDGVFRKDPTSFPPEAEQALSYGKTLPAKDFSGEKDRPVAYFACIGKICRFLLDRIREENLSPGRQQSLFGSASGQSCPGSAFETDFLGQLEESCREQQHLLETFPQLSFGPATLQKILDGILHGIGLNHIGDTHNSLNVMGMLETRGMEFDHAVILSMNEGRMPAVSQQESFLLQSIKLHYGLPTQTEQTAMAAHHFYSLLQNCRRATLIHIASSSDQSCEESRFLLQLRHELPQNLQAEETGYPFLLFHPRYENRIPMRIAKTPALLQALRNYLSKSRISYSSLSEYLSCPLRFYRQRILRLGEPPEISDELDPGTKGAVFHTAMEAFFKGSGPDRISRMNRPVTEDDIQALRRQKELLVDIGMEEHFPNGQYRHGANRLAYQEILIWIDRYAQALSEEILHGELIVTACEKDFLQILENAVDGIDVKLTGFADRIDLYRPYDSHPDPGPKLKHAEPDSGSILRIVDYKTGATKNLRLDDISLLYDPQGAQAFQLLMYVYLHTREKPSDRHPVQACICSMKEHGRTTPLQGAFLEGKNLDRIREETETFVKSVLNDILDPRKEIRCTEDPENCTYCPYNGFCQAEGDAFLRQAESEDYAEDPE